MPDDPYATDLRPVPAGLRLARATWDDLARVTELYRRCERDRIGHPTTRPEDVRFRWLEQGGPGRDTLLVMALLRTALQAFWQRGLTGAALEVDDVMELPLPPPPAGGAGSGPGRRGPG